MEEDLAYTNRLLQSDSVWWKKRINHLFQVPSRWNLSEFQTEFAKLTPLLILWQMRDRQLSPYTHHRERILFALENLPEAARLPSPKFVYSHIMAPHRPFVFDAQGRDVSRHDVGFTLAGPEDAPKATWKDPRWLTGGKEQTREEFVESYRQQITFLSNRIREVIERVLEASASPPVIVVQGDHGYLPPHDYSGPNPIERFRIINAYLLPDGGSDHIYPEITPVNTFRVIFNHYFGQKFELLPDRNYGDPTEEDHKSFVDVTVTY